MKRLGPLKFAILILGYNAPGGAAALTEYFRKHRSADGDVFDVFIHVDQKLDLDRFQPAIAYGAIAVKQRVSVYWCGWTMVEAAMRLIFEAQAHGVYDRFVLISDDSLPLVSADELASVLDRFPNFAHIFRNDARRPRYDRFYMFDSQATQLRWTEDRAVSDDAISRFTRLAALKKRGKKPLERYYQGSQFMALAADDVRRLTTSWYQDVWMRESFEFSDTPDEAYIQSVLGNGGGVTPREFMLVEWAEPTLPRTFTSLDELAGIKRTTELFCRKVALPEEDYPRWFAHLGR